jgi:hypothetical protein
MTYKVTEEDIQLIMQEWDPYWKILVDGFEREQPRNEEEEQHNSPRNDQEHNQENGVGDAIETTPSSKHRQ